MKNNFKKEVLLSQYEKEIKYLAQIIYEDKYKDNSRENALKDLAVLQLSYEYMQEHDNVSGYPMCRGLWIPFPVYDRIKEIRK
jgi:hypothetical protein